MKLDRLLEGYLDKVIDSKEYQNKKNSLIQEKLSLQGRIKEISDKGAEWLEPLKNFIGSALMCAKIARAKNTDHDLAIMAKTVGSNFFLFNQQLQVEYRNRGYLMLAATPSAANSKSPDLEGPTLLPSSAVIISALEKIVKAFEDTIQVDLIRQRWEEIKMLNQNLVSYA